MNELTDGKQDALKPFVDHRDCLLQEEAKRSRITAAFFHHLKQIDLNKEVVKREFSARTYKMLYGEELFSDTESTRSRTQQSLEKSQP